MSSRLERKIYGWVDRRIQNAYPEAVYREELQAEAEQRKTIFAYGLCFYKIALLLVVGAFLGDIVETIFCRVTAGVWMSRSSFVWGPFSIVWGVALAAATMLLYRYRKYSDRFLFFMGTFLGGAYEYTCSVLTEMLFGKVFWDYSKIPFNLGGRINLLYCFFWGIAAVVWIKGIYPGNVRLDREDSDKLRKGSDMASRYFSAWTWRSPGWPLCEAVRGKRESQRIPPGSR